MRKGCKLAPWQVGRGLSEVLWDPDPCNTRQWGLVIPEGLSAGSEGVSGQHPRLTCESQQKGGQEGAQGLAMWSSHGEEAQCP